MILLVAVSSGLWGDAGLDDLYRRFQVDLPPADVVILLDASGSMAGKFTPCRRAVVDFVRQLTTHEIMHLRLFGDVPEAPLEGRGDQVASQVDHFLRTEPFPAKRKGTDIGMAIHKGLEFLERPEASAVQAFFLLTDGQHQPFPHIRTPYTRDFDNDSDWQDLYQRGHALAQSRTVFVYGYGLGERTDIALLRRVFPERNVELIPGDAAGVAQVLEQVRQRLQREQLRRAIEQELRTGGIEAQLAMTSIMGKEPHFQVPISVRNTYKHLPMRLEQVRLQVEEGEGMESTVEGFPSGSTLEPGQTMEGSVRGSIFIPSRRWRLGKKEERYQTRLVFFPNATFVHEEVLKELGFDPKVSVQTASLSVDVRRRVGIPLWIAIGLLMALLVDVWGIIRLRSYQPPDYLPGQLLRSGTRVESIDLSRFSKTEVTLGPNQDIDLSVPGVSDSAVASLRLEEDNDFAHLVLDSHHAGVQVNGEPLIGIRRLEVGDTIRIGQDSLTVTGEVSTQVRFTHPTLLLVGLIATLVLIVLLLIVGP